MMRLIAAFALALVASGARAEVAIQEITTPGGIDLWLVEEHAIPFVALEISIDGGASLDAPGKRGAINLMTATIEEGSGDMDARAFQTAVEDLAASFNFDVYDDSFSVSAKFLSEDRDAAVALLRQALLQPRFDPDAIDRVRGQILSIIASDAKDPDTIAGAAMDAAAYGTHPYGSSLNGTIDSVTALTRDDILAANRAVLDKGRAYVSVVGDISPSDAAAMVDSLLGDLPVDGPALPADVPFGLAGGTTVIPFDTPQSVAIFSQRGIKRDDPDFFAAYVLNTIIGGRGPESRLMSEVREKRGLTYGVSTYLVPKEHTEYIVGSVASANDKMGAAIDVIRAQWADLAAKGVTQEELDAAKTYVTGEYPLRFDGNGEIADIMVGMQMIGLTPAYVVDRNAFIEAVTLADVNRVAAELLDPAGLHFVVVGQPVGVESD